MLSAGDWAASSVGSCFSGRLTSAGFHDSRLNRKQRSFTCVFTAHVTGVLRVLTNESAGWRRTNKSLSSYITQHFGFYWDPFPKIFQNKKLLGLLKEKPFVRWKVRDSWRSLFTCRIKGYPDQKVLLNKHGINVRVFLGFLVLTHVESSFV